MVSKSAIWKNGLLNHLSIESTFVVVYSYIVGIIGLTIVTVSAFKSGIAFDTAYELGVGNLSYQLNETYSLTSAYEFMPNASEFYGVFVQKGANFLNQFFTTDYRFLDGSQHSAYMWQYLVVLILLLISIFALTKAIEIFTSGVRVFHLVFLFFFTNPLILGHLQINYKDAPVAFALLTYVSGLILFNFSMLQNQKLSVGLNDLKSLSVRDIFSKFFKEPRLYLGIFFMFFGFFVAVSCRGGSIALLFGLWLSGVTSFAILFFQKYQRLSLFNLITYFISHALTITIALYAVASINELAKINLYQWLYDSIMYAANNPAVGLVRTAGLDAFNNPVPAWYISAWILISLPVVVFSGLSFGVYYLLRFPSFTRVLLILPLISMGILAPLVLTVTKVSLIDGIRQVLFIPLGFISVGLVGLILWSHFEKKPISIVVVLSISSFALIQTIPWVPYSYAYKNEFSILGRLQPAWENDYLGISVREGVEKLKISHGLSTVIVTPSNDMAHPWNDTPYVINGNKIVKWPNDPFPDTFGVYIFHRYTWTDKTNFPIDSCDDFPLQPSCKDLKPYDCEVLFTVSHGGWEFGRGGMCRKKPNLG